MRPPDDVEDARARDGLADLIDTICARMERARARLLASDAEAVRAARARLLELLDDGDDHDTIMGALAGGGHYCDVLTNTHLCHNWHEEPVRALRAWAVARCVRCAAHVCAGEVDPDWEPGQTAPLCRTCATSERDGAPPRAELHERTEP